MSETAPHFTPDLVIYHDNCYDGFTAAWLLHKAFPRARFIGASYGQPRPAVSGNTLVVDFSFPREEMVACFEAATEAGDEFLVLDHHKTAQEACAGLDFCVFDMDRAGCQMAWDWLASQERDPILPKFVRAPRSGPKGRPWLVEHVADRDLWRMALPDTPAVHAYYSTVPMTFADWDALAGMDRAEVVRLGLAVRQGIDRYCEKVAAEALRAETQWGPTWIVNAPYLNASELVSWIVAHTSDEWAVAWFQRRDGHFQYSLRGRGRDVSEIAKSYGGGGHIGAAGFESGLPPWKLWDVRSEPFEVEH